MSRCFCLNNQIMDVYNRTNILNQIPIQKILLSKNFVERALGFHFRGETRISRHCVRRPHLPLVETKGEWRKLTNGRAPFYNHVAIEKGSRQLRREGKLECLDKAWKCVYVCVRERGSALGWQGVSSCKLGGNMCVCVRERVWIWSKKQANGVNFSFFILFPILGPHRRSEGKQKGVLDVDVWLDDSFHKRLWRKYILPNVGLNLNIGFGLYFCTLTFKCVY